MQIGEEYRWGCHGVRASEQAQNETLCEEFMTNEMTKTVL